MRETEGRSLRIGLSGSESRTYRREDVMSKQVWLITGAGRGMRVDFARAGWASGHSVVASGRDRERVSEVLEHRAICSLSTEA